MVAQSRCWLSIFLLLTLATLSVSCLHYSEPEQAGVSACAEEQVTVLDPGWELSWSAHVEDEYVSGPPLLVGEHLIAVGRTSGHRTQPRIRAYQSSSGQELWEVSGVGVGATALQTLTVTPDYIATYVPCSATVLRIKTGEPVLQLHDVWVFGLALDDEQLYVHDYFGNIRAYGLPSGQMTWERQLPGANRNGYLFVKEGQLVVDLFDELWILDTDNGQTIGRFPDSEAASWLIQDTFLLGESGIGLAYLHLVSLRTGDVLWRKEYWPVITYEPPGYANGILFFPADLGEEGARVVLAVELDTGELVWSYQPEEGVGVISGVAVSNGTGYAVFSDGTLRAIDLEAGEARVIVKSEALYHWGMDTAEDISVPGIAASDSHLFVSFGCRSIYALEIPERAAGHPRQ